MKIVNAQFVKDFRAEAERQKDFTNSFWRQLAVILVAIIIIQAVGPFVVLWGTNLVAHPLLPGF
ncbi:hypothetical protein A2V68_01580 [candidate division Kazan bacterium RBG_13_50_9]|uniref:Uncharacterized protein n=1 Tax=candidate division Kazan bacterium RBG_13_50_9 TaxID=1798535 RepID=A0A1F4NS11_UNCK3|nr:MAG: hypothetical protein A2V68_01580 [candidate division Kazan bacterium RBG_13_50_9]